VSDTVWIERRDVAVTLSNPGNLKEGFVNVSMTFPNTNEQEICLVIGIEEWSKLLLTERTEYGSLWTAKATEREKSDEPATSF